MWAPQAQVGHLLTPDAHTLCSCMQHVLFHFNNPLLNRIHSHTWTPQLGYVQQSHRYYFAGFDHLGNSVLVRITKQQQQQ